jgi:hypothetical protein
MPVACHCTQSHTTNTSRAQDPKPCGMCCDTLGPRMRRESAAVTFPGENHLPHPRPPLAEPMLTRNHNKCTAGTPAKCVHGACAPSRTSPAYQQLIAMAALLAPIASLLTVSRPSGTVSRVAPGGCYPPSCPVEPGRSSASVSAPEDAVTG